MGADRCLGSSQLFLPYAIFLKLNPDMAPSIDGCNLRDLARGLPALSAEDLLRASQALGRLAFESRHMSAEVLKNSVAFEKVRFMGMEALKSVRGIDAFVDEVRPFPTTLRSLRSLTWSL